MPAASQFNTSQTVMRRPRIHGWPERFPGSMLMRELILREYHRQVGYTYSHGMTDAQGYYGTSGQAAGTGAYTQNMYDRKDEWGPSFFDNKHNLSGSMFYQLPFGRKRPIGNTWPGWLDKIAGGWQLGALFSFHTGFPLTPKVSGDPSGTGSRSVRPNVNGTPDNLHQIGGTKLYTVPTAYSFGSPGTFWLDNGGDPRCGNLSVQNRQTSAQREAKLDSATGVKISPVFPGSVVYEYGNQQGSIAGDAPPASWMRASSRRRRSAAICW
jgi:hypothetical protein